MSNNQQQQHKLNPSISSTSSSSITRTISNSSSSTSSNHSNSSSSPRLNLQQSLPSINNLNFFDLNSNNVPLLQQSITTSRSFINDDEGFTSSNSNSDSYDYSPSGELTKSNIRSLESGGGTSTDDGGSYYSSRANSPVPPPIEHWEGYRPELLSYRTISRNRSRAPSGTTTPTNSNDKEKSGNEYFSSHHHQTSALLRKLGGTFANEPTPIMAQKKRRPNWWARRAESRRKPGHLLHHSSGDADGLLGGNSSSSSSTSSSSSSSKPTRNRSCLSNFCSTLLRQPWVPTQPLSILFTLLLFTCFAATLTTFLVHYLNPDKARLPFRTYCQTQRPFPHALADSLAPVNVFVGVFSIDAAYERRHLIRTTYARHTKPIDPATGLPGQNVQLKFILGRPRTAHARRVAMEMESFNDIVVLDIKENMNKGKTHEYFKWASENATVPVYYLREGEEGGLVGRGEKVAGVGFKKADYVVKADDDSLLVLSELERHLRVAPREKVYWGYLIRNLFMGGEAYALSADLVQYIATYSPLLPFLNGAEDQRVGKWMRLHPQANQVNWISERCYIYDHPKAGTTYSHGFLFPSQVEQMRLEGRKGLSEMESKRRGGELRQSFSTVSRWKESYSVPVAGMTIEEEVEALIEGGGRWSGENWRASNGRPGEAIKWETIVFEKDDERLMDRRKGMEGGKSVPIGEDNGVIPGVPIKIDSSTLASSTGKSTVRIGKDLYRDPEDVDAVKIVKRSGDLLDDSVDIFNAIQPPAPESLSILDVLTGSGPSPEIIAEAKLAVELLATSTLNSGSSLDSTSTPSILAEVTSSSSLDDSITSNLLETSTPTEETTPTLNSPTPILDDDEAPINTPTGQFRFPAHNYVLPPSPHDRFLPPPTLRYDPTTMSIREARMLGLPHGGTVAVHYLKRHEWFLEAALALIGREKMWDGGREALQHVRSASSHSSTMEEEGEEMEVSRLPTWKGVGTVEAMDPYWGVARMYGSPIVRDNGFIEEGRPVEARAEILRDFGAVSFGRLRGTPRLGFTLEDGEEVGEVAVATAVGEGDDIASQ